MPSSIKDPPKLARGSYAHDHEAWAAGKATPFLPGPSVNTLILHRQDRPGHERVSRPTIENALA